MAEHVCELTPMDSETWETTIGVEVVRCRDCKLCDERYGRMLCRRDMSCDEIALDVKPDGFCAWGERRKS